MKRTRISLDQDDLRILKEIYNIDLNEPNSIKEFQERSMDTLEQFHKTQHQIYITMYPHRKKRIPNGQKCSFCLNAENEVHAMAKHESGFNLCNKCIKTIRNAENE